MIRVNVVNMAWQLPGNRELIMQATADADVVLVCEALRRVDGTNVVEPLAALLPEGWATNQDTEHGKARGQVAVCWRESSMESVASHPLRRLSGATSVAPGSPDRLLSSETLRHRASGDTRPYAAAHAPVERTGKQPEFYAALDAWLDTHPTAVVGIDANRAPAKAAARVGRPFTFIGREVMALLLPDDLRVAGERYDRVRGSDHPIVRATLRTPTKETPMSTGIYLEDHPPVRSQFRTGRRAKPTGLFVIHTAEGVMDTVGVDTGAEAVADFIRRRSEPGSYHRLGDSDSRVKLVRLSNEAYGDGTGSNPFAIHVSFACKTTDWAKMSKERRAGFLKQGALSVVEGMTWLEREYGVTVPLKRVTKAQSDAGAPGFISHGERDPGRRSDPGADFPWAEFFAAIRELLEPDRSQTPNITAFREAKSRKERREIAKRIVAGRAAPAAKAEAQGWLDADAEMTRRHRRLVALEEK